MDPLRLILEGQTMRETNEKCQTWEEWSKRLGYVDPECSECRARFWEGRTFFPSHEASPGCESGGHDHCSCDVCF